MNRQHVYLCFLIAMLCLTPSLNAQIWVGGAGDDNWSTDANWSGGVSPVSGTGTVVTFDPSVNLNSVNDITPMMLNQLVFNDAGYSISGLALEFAGTDPDLLLSNVGTTSISNDFTINTLTTIDGLNSTDSILNYSGTTSGTGNLFIQEATVIATGVLNNSEIEVGGAGANSVLQVDGTVGAGTDIEASGDGTFFGTISGTGTIDRQVTLSGGKLSSTGTLTLSDDLVVENTGPVIFSSEIETGTVDVSGMTDLNWVLNLPTGATLGGTGDIRLLNDSFLRLDGGDVSSAKDIFYAIDIFGGGTTSIATILLLENLSYVMDNDIAGVDLDGSMAAQLDFDLQENTEMTINGEITQNNEGLIRFLGRPIGNATSNLVLNSDIVANRVRINTPMVGGTGTITASSLGQNLTFGGLLEISNGAIVGPTHTIIVDGGLLPVWPGNQVSSPEVNATVLVRSGGVLIGGIPIGNGQRPICFNAAVTFEGSTEIRSESVAGNNSRTHVFNSTLDVSTGTLTIFENQTVIGTGSVVIQDGANLVNNGILELPIVAQGDLDGGTGSDICTDVVLETATASGDLDIEGSLTVREMGESSIDAGASVDVEGATNIEEGTLVIEDSATFFGTGDIAIEDLATLTANGSVIKNITAEPGALLEGDGEIVGDVTVLGTLAPGNSAGTLDIDGCVDLPKNSMTVIEIGGTTPGTGHDQINNSNMTMTAHQFEIIDSDLIIVLINNFYPRNSDTFTIVQGYDIMGNYRNVVGGRVALKDGTSFAIQTTAPDMNGLQEIILFDYTPGLGDGNGDGDVNLLDVQPFVNAISGGGFVEQLDINRDGELNLLDVAGFIQILAG